MVKIDKGDYMKSINCICPECGYLGQEDEFQLPKTLQCNVCGLRGPRDSFTYSYSMGTKKIFDVLCVSCEKHRQLIPIKEE